MWLAKKALPLAASLAIIAAVTAVLWYIKVTFGASSQFIYFYLFPVILIRVLFSDALAAFSAVMASVLPTTSCKTRFIPSITPTLSITAILLAFCSCLS